MKTEADLKTATAPDAAPSRTPFARVTSSARRVPRWWPLPLGLVAGALAGGVYGAVSTPQYTATSYVIAVPTKQSDPMSAIGFAQAYGRVATQVAVLADAQDAAGVSVQALKSQVRAETSPDAPMVALSASDTDPARAKKLADAVARALTSSAKQAKPDTHVKLLRFSKAARPTEPSTPSTALTTLVGGCAGGLLGGLVLLVRPRREPGAAMVPAPAAAGGPRGDA
ncbi:lipopolysaccharide biosynthesis protein [Streptomyces sp. NPDC051684]|uniref:lipopolysaccharide biosynthesis protein n=1 Tax=Streptomyces sp. NPDC051684 TaxID=3365670 RepID=UPI003797FE80